MYYYDGDFYDYLLDTDSVAFWFTSDDVVTCRRYIY